MLYPAYVHNEGSAYGITIPDFPGCFSAADTWDELPDKERARNNFGIFAPEVFLPPRRQ